MGGLPSRAALGMVVLWATPVRASALTQEFGGGFAHSTPREPRASYLVQRYSAQVDLSDALTIFPAASLTQDSATPRPRGGRFAGSDGQTFTFEMAADWQANDIWDFAGSLIASPWATLTSDSRIDFSGPNGNLGSVDAQVASRSNFYGGSLLADALVLQGPGWELEVALSFGLNRYESEQSVRMLQTKDGPVSADRFRDQCAAASGTDQRRCTPVLSALGIRDATLWQSRFGLDLIETLRRNTDLELSAGYSVYNGAPGDLGYFSVITAGRLVSFGTGFAVAPIHWSLSPAVTQRFGRTSVTGWYRYARYVPGQGDGHSFGTRVAFPLGRRVRLALSAAAQDDLDVDRRSLWSFSGTAALQLRF